MATMRESIAVFDGGPPVSDRRRYLRGAAWMTLAELAGAAGDGDAAGAALVRAEADFAESSTEPALRAESLRSRAELCSRRVAVLGECLDPESAERSLRDAIALQRESMAQGVPNPRDPMVLASCVTTLGQWLMFHGRPDEALVVLDEALRLAQALPERCGWPPPPVWVAEVHAALGQTMAQIVDADGDAHFRESLAAWQSVVEQFPNTVEFRVKLGGTLHNFGNNLRTHGRIEEALEAYGQARSSQQQALARSPHDTMALDFLSRHLTMIGVCQAALGNGDLVAEAARALSALDSRDPQVALRAAECHLRVFECRGRVDAAALDAAMAQLLVAEQRGLTAAQLPQQGLEALQDRPDFRALTDRLAKSGSVKGG
jgi:tetratricopeptide (TPR) repeat protein